MQAKNKYLGDFNFSQYVEKKSHLSNLITFKLINLITFAQKFLKLLEVYKCAYTQLDRLNYFINRIFSEDTNVIHSIKLRVINS